MTADPKLRIALFSGNYNYMREGANQALNHLVGYLERRGHQVRVYSPVTDTPAFEPAGTLVPVPSVTAPFRKEFQIALGLPAVTRRDLEAFAPAVIHVSTPDLLDLRAQTFAKKHRIPIVASLHTRFETYLDYYGLGWLRPLLEAYLNRFYRRADLVLAPTPALIEHLKRIRGDDRVGLFSRGVDRALFNPSRRDGEWRRSQGWGDDDPVVLFFGRPVIEKGLDIYTGAIELLKHSRRNVRALVVGAGPNADRLGAIEGAVLTGHLTGPDLARAVASADLMINPSVTEAFGNVVLEAMASGLAVVCADADYSRAIVDPGRTGILEPSRDARAYATAALRLIDDPEERARIGAAARESTAAFTWDAASAAVEAAYFRTVADGSMR
ncbi:glycosyltransferase family 4 protein [Sphingomonas sp. URHD0057]|uniref:glycosyltransferase family 4 protein n=1 Tax=Sphingomonas sp. URHD0057 TaxID=1380389 RepID=UPI0006891789|nr:glycosyltransferase family 1 protein [Sphingomonas sp. URHD0057]